MHVLSENYEVTVFLHFKLPPDIPFFVLSHLPLMDNSLIIRHLSGSSKGKEQVIAAQEASFGTGPGNTVRFDPVWDKGVGPKHLRVFRDESGQWWMEDAQSPQGTYINGHRLSARQPLNGAMVIELGKGGPRIELVAPAGQRTPAGSPGQHAGAGQARSGGGTGSKLIGLVAAAALVAVLGIAGWHFLGGGLHFGDAAERLQQTAKAYEQGIGVVVIIGKDGEVEGTGTAWAVTPNMFATNAHVAIPCLRVLKDGGTVYVAVNKRPDQRFRVKDATFHPGYLRNEVSVDGKQPVTTPYDVGLLMIEGTASVTLHMASAAKIESLDRGHQIAFMGFPSEDLRNGGFDVHNPVAIMQMGIISAMVDFWLAPAVNSNRRLIQHNMPAVGGSSGSPIFDSDGDVIGILSGGNMIAAMNIEKWATYRSQIEAAKQEALKRARQQAENQPKKKVEALSLELKSTIEALDRVPLPLSEMKRAPSAAMVNYAQRIDMLQELITAVNESEKQP